MWLGATLVDFDGKGDFLDKGGNPGMRVEELTGGLHLLDIPDNDAGEEIEPGTGPELFAQEREIVEGAAVVASLIDDVLDYFRRERWERRHSFLQESKGVHGSRSGEYDWSGGETGREAQEERLEAGIL